jgi:predicted HicB family RNase H-like nuclease
MAKPKRGATTGRKRDKQINVRVSAAEYAAFSEMADQSGMQLAVWIRLVCRRAAGLPTP